MYLVLCKQERKYTPFFVNPVLNLFIDSSIMTLQKLIYFVMITSIMIANKRWTIAHRHKKHRIPEPKGLKYNILSNII